MIKLPASNTKSKKTILCLAYDDDLNSCYAFWCARYRDISFKEFLNIGMSEFNRKISDIPEKEPLYNRIKSRVIRVNEIKDKELRKFWQEQREAYKIPQIYLSTQELDLKLKEELNNGIKKVL